LFLTCRKMYVESFEASNLATTFIFHSIFEAHRFLTTVSRPRLNNIHSIRIAWLHEPVLLWLAETRRLKYTPAVQWEEICKVLSSMNALYRLHISVFEGSGFGGSSRDPFYATQKELLAPLLQIRARDFVVRLPWQPDESEREDNIEAPPFILERPQPLPPLQDHEFPQQVLHMNYGPRNPRPQRIIGQFFSMIGGLYNKLERRIRR